MIDCSLMSRVVIRDTTNNYGTGMMVHTYIHGGIARVLLLLRRRCLKKGLTNFVNVFDPLTRTLKHSVRFGVTGYLQRYFRWK